MELEMIIVLTAGIMLFGIVWWILRSLIIEGEKDKTVTTDMPHLFFLRRK